MTNSEIITEEGERENEKMGRREVHYPLPSLVREDPTTGAGGHRGVGNPLKNFAPLRYFVKGLQFAVASAFRFPV